VDERPNVYDWVELRAPYRGLDAGTEGVVVAFSAGYDEAFVQFRGQEQPMLVPVESRRMR
jgi:hypothetical protein